MHLVTVVYGPLEESKKEVYMCVCACCIISVDVFVLLVVIKISSMNHKRINRLVVVSALTISSVHPAFLFELTFRLGDWSLCETVDIFLQREKSSKLERKHTQNYVREKEEERMERIIRS